MKFDMTNSFPGKVSIIGAARSGLAAAAFFIARGSDVFISDTCTGAQLQKVLQPEEFRGITFEAGSHTDRVLECDLIILSPGVPSDLPILLMAKQKDIPVWSELETGYRATEAKFLAVTGSTGKSTTVSLLGRALRAAGKESVVAGNIGIPLISVVPSLSNDAIVAAEVSSFQLENIDSFRPLGAAVLNLMKNHLDRYEGEENYYNAKKQIATNFNKENFLVLNALDPKLLQWAEQMRSRTNLVFFGADLQKEDCFWPENGILKYRFQGNTGAILEFDRMNIRGAHNHHNACAASALAKIAGLEDDATGRGICGFEGLAHRLEFVAEINGVRYYNDSKSTTAESITVAVSAFPGSVHLIAGGKDKGVIFRLLKMRSKSMSGTYI